MPLNQFVPVRGELRWATDFHGMLNVSFGCGALPMAVTRAHCNVNETQVALRSDVTDVAYASTSQACVNPETARVAVRPEPSDGLRTGLVEGSGRALQGCCKPSPSGFGSQANSVCTRTVTPERLAVALGAKHASAVGRIGVVAARAARLRPGTSAAAGVVVRAA